MLVTEIINRVKFNPAHGIASDDFRLTDPYIYNVCKSVRSKLLSEEAKKKQMISPWIYQTIPCIEMKECSISECSGCLPVGNCKVFRSIKKIPKIISDDKRPLIESITSMDGSIVLDVISWNQVNTIDSSKWGKPSAFAYIDNEYLYIRSEGQIQNGIRMKALFDDPIKATTFPSLCNNNPLINQENPCQSYYDMEFFSEDDRSQIIITMACDEIYKYFMRSRQDDTTEGKDERQV